MMVSDARMQAKIVGCEDQENVCLQSVDGEKGKERRRESGLGVRMRVGRGPALGVKAMTGGCDADDDDDDDDGGGSEEKSDVLSFRPS